MTATTMNTVLAHSKKSGGKMMENSARLSIEIPEWRFGVNCSDCRHAAWNDMKDDGRVYCTFGYGYNYPSERDGCFYYINLYTGQDH